MTRSAAIRRALLPMLVVAIPACGGGGGGGGQAVKKAPDVELSFPAEDVTTDGESITVRGVVHLPPPITNVLVNALPVTSSDGFATFTIDLPLSPGANNLSVLVEGPVFDREKFLFAGRVTRVDPVLVDPTDLDFDAKHDRFVLVDRATRSVQLLDVASGGRTIVSDLEHGSGPPLGEPSGIAVDANGTRAFVLETNQQVLDAVDLATGARSGLSGGGKGGGPALDFPVALAFDLKHARLLVADFASSVTGRLLAVDPDTGDRTVVSDATHGSGPGLGAPNGLAVDDADGRAFFTENGAVLSIDLANGDRTVVSDATHGNGEPLAHPSAAEFDADLGVVLVCDDDRVVAVDAKSGDRSTLSGDGAGKGPEIARPAAIALERDSGFAFVLDRAGPAITKILVKNGSRAASVLRLTVGGGPSLDHALRVAFDPASRRAFTATDDPPAVVAIDLATGDRSTFSDETHGSGPVLVRPRAVALDAARGRLLVNDDDDDSLWNVSLRDAKRTLVSREPPTGDPVHSTREIVLDAARGRALLLQSDDRILSVDLATGGRTTLSQTLGGPLEAKDADGAVLDAANDRLLVHAQLLGLLAVALDDGARTLVSSQVGGIFEGFGSGLGVDPSADRILLTLQSPFAGGVGAVDPADGKPTVLSTTDIANLGRGPTLDVPSTFAFDEPGRSALVLDHILNALFEVDLASGDRTIISK
jgi:DNA-binding beta-propeller fold protein YncE